MKIRISIVIAAFLIAGIATGLIGCSQRSSGPLDIPLNVPALLETNQQDIDSALISRGFAEHTFVRSKSEWGDWYEQAYRNDAYPLNSLSPDLREGTVIVSFGKGLTIHPTSPVGAYLSASDLASGTPPTAINVSVPNVDIADASKTENILTDVFARVANNEKPLYVDNQRQYLVTALQDAMSHMPAEQREEYERQLQQSLQEQGIADSRRPLRARLER